MSPLHTANRRTQHDQRQDHVDAGWVDHAASYLRERLNRGPYAGMSGRYAGYTMCGLLDVLAAEIRGGAVFSAPLRSTLMAVVTDLAVEEARCSVVAGIDGAPR